MKRLALIYTISFLCVCALGLVMSGSVQAQGSYKQRVINTRPNALLLYLPLDEISGTTAHDASGNARHGALCGGGSAPSWNAAYFEDGVSPAPRFDGNDCVNGFTSSLASVFNGNSGTIFMWLKPWVGTIWSDSTFRRMFWTSVNGSNLLTMQHLNATINMIRIGGGVDKRAEPNWLSGTGWRNLAITWSSSANEARYYLDGVIIGTQTAIGTWSGSIVDFVVGAGDVSGTFGWNGFIGHVALWNVALTGSEIATISVIDTSILTPPPIGMTDTPTPTPTLTPTPDLLRYLPIGSGYGAVAMTFTAGEVISATLLMLLVMSAFFGVFLFMRRR